METKVFNNIEYQMIGSGMPIIFLHGLFLDKNSTKNFFEKDNNLAKFQHIYLDIPGMGNSLPTSEVTTDAIFKKLLDFIDDIIGAQKFAIYGHSYGGYLAQAIAYHYQNQVNGLFLTCPVTIADKELRLVERHKNEFIGKVHHSENETFYDDFESMNVLISQSRWAVYQDLILPGLNKANTNFLKHLQENSYAISFEEKLQNLGQNTKIQLVLGRHDHVVGYKQQLNKFISGRLQELTEHCKLLKNLSW
ncbi:alpha/beta hydrolase [Leuconostoc rapi]|uniref:alpha/beta hydrolase n=1 Tax=Leuconostoc rapi TaxID=1406906 RepID=UPI00195B5F30|nr:alpha/beta fold hydrolase [Leuconostoc rapi]MBM7435130.1 pimeloyl-ACP methyl ester carboxylesterase [Leuconostoc rapi]